MFLKREEGATFGRTVCPRPAPGESDRQESRQGDARLSPSCAGLPPHRPFLGSPEVARPSQPRFLRSALMDIPEHSVPVQWRESRKKTSPRLPSGPTPESASNSSRLVFEVLEQTGTDGTQWVRLWHPPRGGSDRGLRASPCHIPKDDRFPQARPTGLILQTGLGSYRLQPPSHPQPRPHQTAGQQRKDIMSRPLPISEHLGDPPPPHPAHGRPGRRELRDGSRL